MMLIEYIQSKVSRQVIHWVVIVGVILMSGLIALLINSQRNLTLMFIASAGLGILFLILRWPVLGIILSFAGGFFVPFTGPSGLNVAMIGISFMVILWVLEILIRRRHIDLHISPTTRPVYIFILISFLAFGFGQILWYTLAAQAPIDVQLAGLFIFIISAFTFLVVAHFVADLRWLKVMTWSFIALGSLYILGRLLPGSLQFGDRLFDNGVIAQSMFWTWLVALTFGQVIFNTSLSVIQRGALALVVAATMYIAVVINYDWKSGWVPALVALVVVIGLRFFHYWKRILVILPFTLLPAWYVATLSIASDEYSWSTRLEAWQIVLQIVKVNPIFGLGFANYHFYTPLFPIRGYAVQFNSHSQIIDLIAQTGILGLICFFWIFWEVGKLGWRMRDSVPAGFPRAYVNGVLGGLIGTLVAAGLVDWILPFVYNIGLKGFRGSILAWLFLGGLVSLERILRKPPGVTEADGVR